MNALASAPPADTQTLESRIVELLHVRDVESSDKKEVSLEEQQRVQLKQNAKKEVIRIMQALNMQFYKFNGRYLVLERKHSDLKLTNEMRNQIYQVFHSNPEYAALPPLDRCITFWNFYDQSIAENGKSRVSLKVTDDPPPEVALAERLGLTH